MNKIEEIALKGLIVLHRLKRELVPYEDRRRAREWRRHARYEIPRASKDIKFDYVRRDLVEAIEAYQGL